MDGAMDVGVGVAAQLRLPLQHGVETLGRCRIVEIDERLAVDGLGLQQRETGTDLFDGHSLQIYERLLSFDNEN